MQKPVSDIIEAYIKTPSRNKIIFHKCEIPDLVSVNVGLKISEAIYNFKEPGKIAMKVSFELYNILNSSILHDHTFGKYLSIQNPGILFEKELKIDFCQFLDKYSQNNALFVNWDGEIDTDNIYFLTKEKGIKINIKNLSYIAI